MTRLFREITLRSARRFPLARAPWLLLAIASMAAWSACSSGNDPGQGSGGAAGQGGGNAGGATGGQGGSSTGGRAGSEATGGQGGGDAAGGSGGSTASSAPDARCSAQWDALQAKCPLPEDSRAANVADCVQAYRQYEGIGCDDEFDGWVSCTLLPGYDCSTDTGCEVPQNGYFACGSQATARTLCTRLTSRDTLCQPSTPYAFGCLASIPSGCTLVEDGGAGIWCCPKL
jgi:hypothetical protein